MNEIEQKIEEVKKEIDEKCNIITKKIKNKEPTIISSITNCFLFTRAYKVLNEHIVEVTGQQYDITPEILNLVSQAELKALQFSNDVLKKQEELYNTLYQLKEDYKEQAQGYNDQIDKAREDLKKKVEAYADSIKSWFGDYIELNMEINSGDSIRKAEIAEEDERFLLRRLREIFQSDNNHSHPSKEKDIIGIRGLDDTPHTQTNPKEEGE